MTTPLPEKKKHRKKEVQEPHQRMIKLIQEWDWVTAEQIQDSIQSQTKLQAEFEMNQSILDIMVAKKYLNETQKNTLMEELGLKKKKTVALPGFELEKKIGRGGMGMVFRAKRLNNDELVAIKILPLKMAKSKNLRQRFVREAKAAAQLKHPNLVGAFEVRQNGGYLYYVMEYVDGQDLSKLLGEDEYLPERQALKIIRQVALALDYAHKENFIHRDVKPENILIDQTGLVKLGDLGLAKNVEEEDHALTMTGMPIGSPKYISPEQAKGVKNVDLRSDIYSLGATLYRMVVGRPPFEGENAAMVMAKHMNEPITPPRHLNEEVSEVTNRLILKMMSKLPQNRHANAAEVIAEIDAILNRKSTTIHSVSNLKANLLAQPLLTNKPKSIAPSEPTYVPLSPDPSQPISKKTEPTLSVPAETLTKANPLEKISMKQSLQNLSLAERLALFGTLFFIGGLLLFAAMMGYFSNSSNEKNEDNFPSKENPVDLFPANQKALKALERLQSEEKKAITLDDYLKLQQEIQLAIKQYRHEKIVTDFQQFSQKIETYVQQTLLSKYRYLQKHLVLLKNYPFIELVQLHLNNFSQEMRETSFYKELEEPFREVLQQLPPKSSLNRYALLFPPKKTDPVFFEGNWELDTSGTLSGMTDNKHKRIQIVAGEGQYWSVSHLEMDIHLLQGECEIQARGLTVPIHKWLSVKDRETEWHHLVIEACENYLLISVDQTYPYYTSGASKTGEIVLLLKTPSQVLIKNLLLYSPKSTEKD